jgi:hypothetical protein
MKILNNYEINCKTQQCKILLMESLANSGIKTEYIKNEVLYNCNNVTSTKSCQIALKLLNNIDIDDDDMAKNWDLFIRLLELFENEQRSNEIRIFALNLLFNKFESKIKDNSNLENILVQFKGECLTKKKSNEFCYAFQRRILFEMKNDQQFE